MEAVLVVWVLCAVLGYVIGNPKGLGGIGAVLGGVLGVLGLIIIAVMKPATTASAPRPR